MKKIDVKDQAKTLDNRILITGKSIQGTIETMASLGDIGKQVLRTYGIEKVIDTEFYSYEIRSQIHKAVYDRFGEIALLAIGFRSAELIFDHTALAQVYKRELKNIESQNDEKKNEALKLLFQTYVTEGDKVIKRLNKESNFNFGNSFIHVSKNSFKLRSYSTWLSYQSHFLIGILEYVFSLFFARHWQYQIKYQESETEIIEGFYAYCMTIDFKPYNSSNSAESLVNQRRNEIKDRLLQAVLNEAEAQKENVQRQKEKVEELSQQIGKYIPPQIHHALVSGEYDTSITTRRRKLTVFFSDIKNFTTTSEMLQPEDLTKYLNEYFSEMTEIAINCGGTIDKYIGDAMMVFFGDPETKGERDDARACVEMSLQMQDRMKFLKTKWEREGFANPFQIRMGINTGYCNVGNFGSNQRLTYTIIGAEVNLAQRLETSAEANGILISYETFAHVQDMVNAQQLESFQMKGISREIKIFKINNRRKILPRKDVNDTIDDSTSAGPHSLESLATEIELLKKKVAALEESSPSR